LKAELELLKKQNLELEIKKQKESLAKEIERKNAEETEKLRSDMRAEIEKELLGKTESRIVSEKPETLNASHDGFEEFKARYVQRQQKLGKDIKGRTYEQLMEEMQYGSVSN